MRTDRTLLPVLVLLLGYSVALADGFIIVPDPAPTSRPVPHAFAPLEVVYHHVTVTIRDQVAVTEVDQEFYNPNNARLEGQYLFPLPRGANIDNFEMDIEGKMVQAELLDAEKARKIYEDIVRKMRDPALLEYVGQGLFKARIFPIEPNSRKRVKLRYTELLRSDGGMVGVVIDGVTLVRLSELSEPSFAAGSHGFGSGWLTRMSPAFPATATPLPVLTALPPWAMVLWSPAVSV